MALRSGFRAQIGHLDDGPMWVNGKTADLADKSKSRTDVPGRSQVAYQVAGGNSGPLKNGRVESKANFAESSATSARGCDGRVHYPVPVNGTGQSASPFWLPLPATEAARLLGKGGERGFLSFSAFPQITSDHTASCD